MKLLEVLRFEAAYQARRVSTWLYFAVLLGSTFQLVLEAYPAKARGGGYFLDSPILVAEVTLLVSLLWLLLAPALAGDAAARDVQARMHPLVYATPVGKGAYLRGRFLAAFLLNALLLLAPPLGFLLATAWPGLEAGIVGPFRPAAYLGAYLLVALPNAFLGTAVLFSLAALSRRAVVGYLGSVLLLLAAFLSWQLLALQHGAWSLARWTDPLGLTAMSEMALAWTPAEKNARWIGSHGALVGNRLAWTGVALGVLALTHLRFRFAHPVAAAGWRRATRPDDDAREGSAPVAVPRVPRSFGAATHVRQALAVAWQAFRAVIGGWGGAALAAFAALLVLTGPLAMQHLGVPLVPTTERIASFLAGPLTHIQDLPWMIVPLLIVFYAGELVWRERETGLSDIADAAPVPDWVPLLGKFLGLGLVLVVLQATLTAAGVMVQARLGHHDFQPGVYARTLFGLLLADYLLFALLAVVVHVVVDRKYVGHLAVLTAYAFMAFAPALGVEHGLLVYGSDPGWEYSDMRGLAPFLGPWLWFKLYWAAWALLLALAARLLWVRGREGGLAWRVRLARRRLTPRLAGAAAVGAGLVLALGGFVFYNTNVLHEHRTADELRERLAEYERRYGRYEGAPQPVVTRAALRVEIHPSRGEVEIRGAYALVNRSGVAIDTLHLATAPEVETGAVRFDRPAVRALADAGLGHSIFLLRTPLLPGDSLRLDFTVRRRRGGFPGRGVDASVVENGTFLSGAAWLPALGYQPDRELAGAGERRAHGLAPQPLVPPLHDAAARRDVGGQRMRFHSEVVVGTDADQVAVAPGRLLRSWTEGGRRYFHYSTDAPIRNDFAVFSAAYAVREGRWDDSASGGERGVRIQVVHHPRHAWNVDGMIRSVRASLAYYTASYGPYPYGDLRLVEHPGPGSTTLHAAPVNIWYQEGFSLLDPERDPRGVDLPFAVVAHEVAHQWWGNQVTPARVEGRALLSESLAWFSALGVVEAAYGPEHLRALLEVMRRAYLTPRSRAGVPLLRAADWFDAYRRGPFAMYALREYVGEDRVNEALRRLLEVHRSGEPPLATSLDLHRELAAVTPDSLRPLLRDLFERNTYWELSARAAAAERTEAGEWRVALDVRARKVVVDTLGVETELPMDDPVEVGVFSGGEGASPGEPLYLRTHRLRSGEQRIVVTVPGEPGRAGIDPRALLVDTEAGDNLVEVERARAAAARPAGGRPSP